MHISREPFLNAAKKAEITEQQAEALWIELEKSAAESQVSPFSKLLYYFGALIILLAMTWLLDLTWDWFDGGAIILISILYAILFLFLGNSLWKRQLKIPGGLLVTSAVCMTPLLIYGLETYWHVWPSTQSAPHYREFYHEIRGSWVFMELGTILAGLIALRFFPFAFLTVPLFFSAWFLSMDIVPLLLGHEGTWEQKEWISLLFGFFILCTAYSIDRCKKEDYAFWAYLFGTLIFWSSFSSLCLDRGELIHFFYFICNILLMLISLLLKRSIFMVAGALGAFIYICHLAYEVFEHSILFPFILSFIGLFILFLGVLYQKNRRRIEEKIVNDSPKWLRKILPPQ